MLKEERQTSKLSVGVRCGDCTHYKRGPAIYEDKCINLGIKAYGKACPSFTPDLFKIAELPLDFLKYLGSVAREFDPTAIRILGYIFRNLDHIQRHGLRFGQPVYFRIEDKSTRIDYLSNYFKAYIISVSPDGQTVFLSGSLDKNPKNTLLALMRDSLIELKQWNKIKADLIAKDRLAPPVNKRKSGYKHPLFKVNPPEAVKASSYTPPTIDTVPQSWLTVKQSKTRIKDWLDDIPTKPKPKPRQAVKVVNGKISIRRK